MNRFSLTLIGIAAFFYTNAQLTFEKNIFPGEGDSLVYMKDVVSKNYPFSESENQKWDFRRSETPLFTTLYFKKSNFYSAGGAESIEFERKGEDMTKLFRKTNDGIEEIGFIFKINSNSTVEIPVYYNEAIQINNSSLNYGKKIFKRVNFSFAINRDDLPKNLQSILPEKIKNIKISGIKTIRRKTDSWGILYLPGETHKTNRVHVIESTEIRLYNAKNGKIIPYFDEKMINSIFRVTKNSNFFEFYSKAYISYTARVNIDQNGKMTSIDYQSKKIVGKTIDISSKKNKFILFPNPTYNIAKIFISNYDSGNYKIAIFNIIGKKLWDRRITVNGQTIIKENFGFLPKGTYLLSLLDENGNILRTTRLIIISV